MPVLKFSLSDTSMILDSRRYQLEQDMLPALLRALQTVLPIERGLLVKTVEQPAVGAVIPDLLIGLVRRRAAIIARNHFTAVEASVLAFLEREGESEEDGICNNLFLPLSTWRKVIARLQRVHAVGRTPAGAWRLSESANTSGIEIIAVEAKLRLWKQALAQAEYYRTFADRAVVVLDGNRLRVTDRIREAFISASVGLWLQHGFAVNEIVAAKLLPPPPSGARYNAAEKLLRSRHSIGRYRKPAEAIQRSYAPSHAR